MLSQPDLNGKYTPTVIVYPNIAMTRSGEGGMPPPVPRTIYIMISASDGSIVQTPMRPLVVHSAVLQSHLFKYCTQKDYDDPVIHCEKKFDVATLLRVIEFCHRHESQYLYLSSSDFARCPWKVDFCSTDSVALAKLVDAALFFQITTLVSYLMCPLPDSERSTGRNKVWEMMAVLPSTKDKFTEVEYLLQNGVGWDNILKELAVVHAKNKPIVEAYERVRMKALVAPKYRSQ